MYAGTGAAADYDGLDVNGAIVVVDRSDDVPAAERADRAYLKGALALVVVNDGVGTLMEYQGDTQIPVATVHRDEGADLVALAQAGTELTLSARRVLAVPLRPDARLPGPRCPTSRWSTSRGNRDLARIDGELLRRPPGAGVGIPLRRDPESRPSAYEELERHPGRRVEWVTPGQDWVESHAQNIDGALPWPMVSG